MGLARQQYGDGHATADPMQRELLRKEEEQAERSKQYVKKEAKFKYRPKGELLASSPSLHDGMGAEKERTWRTQYTRAIQSAGEALRL